MRILYFDCFSGISGDMAIGALLDLGVDREVFLEALSGLNLEGYRIEINKKVVNGISGTDINVVLTDEEHGCGCDHGQDYSRGHEHHHSHADVHSHNCADEQEHVHDHGHEHSHNYENNHDHESNRHHGHEDGYSHNCADEHDHNHNHDHEGNRHHDHADVHSHNCADEFGHSHEHNHEHHHNHDHNHDHNDHHHSHDHTHGHTHKHGERGLAEIEEILDQSSLSEYVKSFSKKVFREIAAAEAKVHGKPIDEVHFHEVGAVDSIVDIAGTAICLELLGIERIYSSALHDGSGFIQCRHGMIPVPVPAVLEMLTGSGIPLISEEVGTELVTPTGMGLIKCLAAGFGGKPPMTVEKTGYGLGKRDTGRLNALRVILGETLEQQADSSLQQTKGQQRLYSTLQQADAQQGANNRLTAAAEQCNGDVAESGGDEIAVLETNIDDTTAEILGYTMSKLLDAGALDAFYTPVFMKKNRPAYMLTVIASPGTEDRMAGIILGETSTIGIRVRSMRRYCMEREIVTVDTPYGGARVKIAEMGGIRKASPEYEDCRRIAESAGLTMVKVYALVMEIVKEKYGL